MKKESIKQLSDKRSVKKMFEAIKSCDALLCEDVFKKIIIRERLRSERTLSPLIILTIDFIRVMGCPCNDKSTLHKVEKSILGVIKEVTDIIRQTDYVGWFKKVECIGVVLTDVKIESKSLIENKIIKVIQSQFNSEMFALLKIQTAHFPVVTAGENPGIIKKFYPEIKNLNTIVGERLKRFIDISGSTTALVMLLPLFLILILIIKISSPGPVLFCQQRIGKYGREFTMYKFRSMYCGVNDQIHRQYVSQLINGEIPENEKTFKIVADPRITPVGKFLRKTSLDELPQLVNVFLGTMSLVGPRPPLSYETVQYKPWHLRRIINVKPGITGMWQVKGRSSTTFDGMVRMDLNYIKNHSLGLDLKLIVQTFKVLFTEKGGY